MPLVAAIKCFTCGEIFREERGYVIHTDPDQIQICTDNKHQFEDAENVEQERLFIELERKRKKLQGVMEQNFPDRYNALEICMSVKAQLLIEDLTQPFALILMGPPSTYKTTILNVIDSLPETYNSDKFTPKSFVSHSANSKKEDLEKIDLLPRIRNKVFITKELGPLFSGNEDALMENIGIMTRILDGNGLQIDSGVHGQRGYTGDYCFMWLGAVVDIPPKIWKIMGNLGPRIYFLRLFEKQETSLEKKERIRKNITEKPHKERVSACSDAINDFWQYLDSNPNFNNNQKIEWNREKDDSKTFNGIIDTAVLLSKLRATIPSWHTEDSDSSGSNYHFEMPTVEDPTRASNALYNLARGHAIIHGRNSISADDLGAVVAVALSSAKKERVAMIHLLVGNNGKLDVSDFVKISKVSEGTARKQMQEMNIIGLVDWEKEEAVTKPRFVVKLKKEFTWILNDKFKKYGFLHTPKNPAFSQKDSAEKIGMCHTKHYKCTICNVSFEIDEENLEKIQESHIRANDESHILREQDGSNV